MQPTEKSIFISRRSEGTGNWQKTPLVIMKHFQCLNNCLQNIRSVFSSSVQKICNSFVIISVVYAVLGSFEQGSKVVSWADTSCGYSQSTVREDLCEKCGRFRSSEDSSWWVLWPLSGFTIRSKFPLDKHVETYAEHFVILRGWNSSCSNHQQYIHDFYFILWNKHLLTDFKTYSVVSLCKYM